MVSTFSTNINLEEPAHGDDVGTWDVPVNANWAVIDKVAGGSLLLNATGLSGTVALTNVQLQPRTIQISNVPTGTLTYTVPTGVGGYWVVRNTTTGGQTIGIASAAGGSTVTIPANTQLGVWCDGTATGMLVSNSVFDSSGVHFPDGTVQTSAIVNTSQTVSAVAAINFTGIASTVNTLSFNVNLTLLAADTLGVQFYDSLGVIDTTAVYYDVITVNNGGTVTGSSAGSAGFIGMTGAGTGSPVSGTLSLSGIQRAQRTLAVWQLTGVDPTNANVILVDGGGGRTTPGPITGVRFLCLSGATLTGTVSLAKSV